MSVDSLLQHRARFPILASTNYLISNSLGAMPAAVRDSLASYADSWATRGVRAWAEGWWTLPGEIGDLVAKLIGAGSGEVGMHLNVTSAAMTFVSSLDSSSRRNGVLVTDMNFPSLVHLYRGQERRGLRVVEVASDDGVGVDTGKLIDAIDETTLFVALDHVLFRSAFIQDAKAITQAAHAKGALVLLDAFQSVGTVPVDVADLGVDAAIGGSLKWLCGGPGACWLWVKPELAARLTPGFTGWMAHQDPFAFDVGPMRYRDDGYRFLNGTPNIPGLMAARPGLEIVSEVGIEAIRAKSVRQTAHLVELALARGFRVTCPTRPEQRGGTVAIDVEDGKAVCQELLARDIVVDYRPKAGIRVSPHFYTKDEELAACVAEIDVILKTRAHERHLKSTPRYG
jgi:kynureninase